MRTHLAFAMLLAGCLAGCATSAPDVRAQQEAPGLESLAFETPPVEYPSAEPIEPVEPPEIPETPPASPPRPPPLPVPTPAPAPVPVPPPQTVPPASVAPAPQAAPTPEVPSDGDVVAALVADLARYASLPPDDVRREINTATQALTRQRSDANRVRLAMLYTLTHSVQDDQRALQLLETVLKANPASPAIRSLAGVIQVQIVERLRAVREEQQKADAAIQKLEALRVLERSLLRDRLRSGGGGAGGGSGGGGGGGR